jgi:hypothetical protein
LREVAGFVCAILLAASLTGEAGAEGFQNAQLFLQFVTRGETAYEEVRDYTATMRSVDRIGEVLEPERVIQLKFQRPFKVYMRWQDHASQGREALYVAGENDGKFLVAEKSGVAKFFTARLDPRDPRLLARSRHPVTDLGIGRLLEIIAANAKRAARAGVLQVVDHGMGKVADRPVRDFEVTLPKDESQGYYGYRFRVSFDEDNHLPIRIVVNDWTDRLVEDYTYTNLVLNPGLRATDFDPHNPAYAFSGWRIPF